MIKDRPILFNAEMVRAILDGRKTQTRRIIKDICFVGGQGDENNPKYWESTRWGSQTDCEEGLSLADFLKFPVTCPFGAPGDRLWVRETFFVNHWGFCNGEKLPNLPSKRMVKEILEQTDFLADGMPNYEGEEALIKWRPSIHMPRWASRITLEIKSVNVSRLHDVTEEDARACGFKSKTYESGFVGDAKWHYRQFWEQSMKDENKPDWYANPWVWVIEFERVK